MGKSSVVWASVSAVFLASAGWTEQRTVEGVPVSTRAVFGNSMWVETGNGEALRGFAWPEGRNGYFCFANRQVICGGEYDASSGDRLIEFEFGCSDGRSGEGIAERIRQDRLANPIRAEGAFSDGAYLIIEFGPFAEYSDADCRRFQ
jgi:hypothetical protein